MTQLSYYRADPEQALPRPAGLVAWGVIIIAIGSLITGGVILIFAGMAVDVFSTGRMYGFVWRQMCLLVDYGLWGVLILWTGIGSIRARLWVRPLLFAVVGVILILGISSLLGRVIRLFNYPWFGPQPLIVTIESLIPPAIGFGVPIAALIYYRREAIRAVLRSRSSGVEGIDFPAEPLFAWSAACVLFGATKGMNVLYAWRYLNNAEINAPWLPIYVLLIPAGLLCYRRIRFAWLATILLVAVLTIVSAEELIRMFNSHQVNLATGARFGVASANTVAPGRIAVNSQAYLNARWIAAVPAFLLVGAYCAAIVYGIRTRRYLHVVPTAARVIPLNPTAHTTGSLHTP